MCPQSLAIFPVHVLGRPAGHRTLFSNGNNLSGVLRADKFGHILAPRGPWPSIREIETLVAVVGYDVTRTQQVRPQDRVQKTLVPPVLQRNTSESGMPAVHLIICSHIYRDL